MVPPLACLFMDHPDSSGVATLGCKAFLSMIAPGYQSSPLDLDLLISYKQDLASQHLFRISQLLLDPVQIIIYCLVNSFMSPEIFVKLFSVCIVEFDPNKLTFAFYSISFIDI